MIKSMTGYGRADVELSGKKLTIEIRSLNSKQTDISLKIPGMFREREMGIRNTLIQELERGKIDLYITTEFTGEVMNYTINRQLIRQYAKELGEIAAELKDPDAPLLPVILKMPDVLQAGRDEASENEWILLQKGIGSAVAALNEFRSSEGSILENDIRERTETILKLLVSIEPFEKARLDAVRERIMKGLNNFLNTDVQAAVDQNRLEQELIFYIERLDITEEKVRLQKHCDYFLATLAEPASQGKKLGFVVQEMGREINTIGSKANNPDIQKIVILMKDELEKIREQLLNIL
jgi:uncharacterized protein (TIGR00255 family)